MVTLRSLCMVILLIPLSVLNLSLAAGPPLDKPLSGVVLYDPLNYQHSEFEILDEIRIFSNIGPNIKVNQDPGSAAQNETTIISNPLNPYNLVGGCNDYRNGEVDGGYYYSFDGGRTWGDGTLSGWPNLDAQGDPAVTCDADGNFYFSVISFDRQSPDNGVYVCKSTDGGVTWCEPVAVIEHFNDPYADFEDKEYIGADITDSPYRNNIYVSWTSFGTGGNPIEFSRSTDGGMTFSTPMEISEYDYVQGSVPAVGPDGEVYVTWYASTNPSSIKIDKSTDGGITFGDDITVARIEPLPSPLPPTDFRVNSFPSIAVDITDGPYSGYIHIIWADYRYNDGDIYYTRSTDGGATWSDGVRINDDPVANGKDQFFPWISCDPQGNLHAFFYDRRNDPNDVWIDGYYTRSTDGGESWSANERVTTASFDPNIGFGGRFIGDYNGIASVGHRAHPLWTDTRDGNQDAYTARIDWGTVPPVNVAMVPDQPPIIIPAGGGSFSFTGILGNNYENAIEGEVWIMLTLPNGNSYGPIRRYRHVPLDPDEIIYVESVVQDVPAFAPAGDYVYRAYAGLYPYAVDSAKLYFTKTVTAGGTEAAEWAVYNWFDSDELTADVSLPGGIALLGNYPNPFNASTRIDYIISSGAYVNLDIYNIAGQKVSTLVDAFQPAGTHSAIWDGSGVSSGVYFYVLTTGDSSKTRRMTLIK
jgi:hypothetical protein